MKMYSIVGSAKDRSIITFIASLFILVSVLAPLHCAKYEAVGMMQLEPFALDTGKVWLPKDDCTPVKEKATAEPSECQFCATHDLNLAQTAAQFDQSPLLPISHNLLNQESLYSITPDYSQSERGPPVV